MVVVYVPKYEKHDYCLREYRAMELVERKRYEIIGHVDQKYGMIIPIILRGKVKDLPPKIKEDIHFCDFRKFSTASIDIGKDEECIDKLETIAEYIHELSEMLGRYEADPFNKCTSFKLPAEAPQWRDSIASDKFPGDWSDD
jgi:hypothetical protein